MRIWFVRHGETLFNRLSRFQGQCDAPLTEKGIHDAERARDALKDTVFTKAFCSYSGRAEDTARIILEGRGIEPVREKQLMEHYVGLLEGALTYDPEVRAKIDHCNETGIWSEVEGEDNDVFRERIRTIMNRIAGTCAEDDQILIVSHGSFCLYMLEVLFGIDQKELRRNSPGYPVPNGGITQVAYEKGVWKLLALPQDPDVYQTV